MECREAVLLLGVDQLPSSGQNLLDGSAGEGGGEAGKGGGGRRAVDITKSKPGAGRQACSAVINIPDSPQGQEPWKHTERREEFYSSQQLNEERGGHCSGFSALRMARNTKQRFNRSIHSTGWLQSGVLSPVFTS